MRLPSNLLLAHPDRLYSIAAIKKTETTKKPDLIAELVEQFPSATKSSIETQLKDHLTKQSEKGTVTWGWSVDVIHRERKEKTTKKAEGTESPAEAVKAA